MRHLTRWMGAGILGLASVGCVSSAPFPGQPTAGDLGRDMTPTEMTGVVRLQRGDDAPILVAQLPNIEPAPGLPALPPNPTPTSTPGIVPVSAPTTFPTPAPTTTPATLPAPAPSSTINVPPPAPPSDPGGVRPIGAPASRSARAAVRAWVNGRPIFDDEVMLELEMHNRGVLNTSADQITKAYNDTLTRIIELEIAYQDAVHKLEKGNPNALKKLREMVEREYEKQVRDIRKNVPEDKFRDLAPTFHRQLERQFIGMEYIRSSIFGKIDSIGYLQVKEYYETHLNEFQKIESLKWQHVFLAVNDKRPSLADAERFANELLQKVSRADPKKQEAEFEALSAFDDGDSKTRKSLGYGSRKGEIAPPILEASLFQMKNGELGPVVPVNTGVHLFRLIERDPGGQIPLNEAVQTQIRNKLRNQVFDREFKRFVRELKARAVVEIERGI